MIEQDLINEIASEIIYGGDYLQHEDAVEAIKQNNFNKHNMRCAVEGQVRLYYQKLHKISSKIEEPTEYINKQLDYWFE